jgi:hypothetical protein
VGIHDQNLSSNPEKFISPPARLDVSNGLRKRNETNRAWHNCTDRQAEANVLDPAGRAVLAEDFPKSCVIVRSCIERKVRVSVIEVVGGLWSQLFVHFTMRWILLGERPTRPDHECDCGERDHYFSRIHCDILLHEIPGCEAAVN